MADVFLSYRDTPERRRYVQRLAAILRAYGIGVWWDYGLEAGESYRAQITKELAEARVVAPLWCQESIVSKWVAMEAELGKDKLVPARLQRVAPPEQFEAIHASDLVGWDGAAVHPRLADFIQRLCQRLARPMHAPADTLEVLSELPALPPLPEVVSTSYMGVSGAGGGSPAAAAASHDFAFWKAEWEAHRGSEHLLQLQAIVDHAPGYFASLAKARMAEIETARAAARQRAEEERQRREAAERAALARAEARRRYETEGRIAVPAPIIHGAPQGPDGEGWFKPGNGRAEWFRDLPEGPEMVVVPAGRFTMGSSAGEPEREPFTKGSESQVPVTISQPFAIGRCAVTRGEFAAFMKATGYSCEDGAYGWTGSEWKQDSKYSWRNPGFPQDDSHPVVCVNWDDARAYCAWLSQTTGQTYQLPSEAQWEYAARALKDTPFWWGKAITPAQANYNGNYTYTGGGAKGAYRKGTLPVDYAKEQFQPNPWGLHQVHGNVWEWCADCWNDGNAGNPGDGSARTTGDCGRRVPRGGSWGSYPQNLRSAHRYRVAAGYRLNFLGFRVGRTLTRGC